MQLINCALLKYPQNTEEQFDYLIQEAYQCLDLAVKPRVETLNACNELLTQAGLVIHAFRDEETGAKVYNLISELTEVGKKLWSESPVDATIVGVLVNGIIKNRGSINKDYLEDTISPMIKKNKPKAYEEYLKSMVDRGMIEARQVGHNTYEYVFTTRAICENMQTFRKILQSMDLRPNCAQCKELVISDVRCASCMGRYHKYCAQKLKNNKCKLCREELPRIQPPSDEEMDDEV